MCLRSLDSLTLIVVLPPITTKTNVLGTIVADRNVLFVSNSPTVGGQTVRHAKARVSIILHAITSNGRNTLDTTRENNSTVS